MADAAESSDASNAGRPTETASLPGFVWQWQRFDALGTTDLYDLLDARSAVFVVEQRCPYRDLDGLDQRAWHLFARDAAHPAQPLAAYARILPPEVLDASAPHDTAAYDGQADVVIGRILTVAAYRGVGLGRALFGRALAQAVVHWPAHAIRLHAQAHLQRFYGAFGFLPTSSIHDEDGIPHLWMRRTAAP